MSETPRRPQNQGAKRRAGVARSWVFLRRGARTALPTPIVSHAPANAAFNHHASTDNESIFSENEDRSTR